MGVNIKNSAGVHTKLRYEESLDLPYSYMAVNDGVGCSGWVNSQGPTRGSVGFRYANNVGPTGPNLCVLMKKFGFLTELPSDGSVARD